MVRPMQMWKVIVGAAVRNATCERLPGHWLLLANEVCYVRYKFDDARELHQDILSLGHGGRREIRCTEYQ
jgi:hypothetical protein